MTAAPPRRLSLILLNVPDTIKVRNWVAVLGISVLAFSPPMMLPSTAQAETAPAAADAAPGGVWLTPDQVRKLIIGNAMQGYYRDAQRWTDEYALDGGIKYADENTKWTGRWSFQRGAFCTYSDDGSDGGCFMARMVSSNCFEFVEVGVDEDGDDVPLLATAEWHARGWRGGEPSTCAEPPTS